MNLRHATFMYAEFVPDLLHGHLAVVIEQYDPLLPIRQRLDRADQVGAGLFLLERGYPAGSRPDQERD